MDQQIEDIVILIKESELDQTIKDILVRDLQEEGLNDFLREQIIAYCMEGLKRADAQIERARKALEIKDDKNPA